MQFDFDDAAYSRPSEAFGDNSLQLDIQQHAEVLILFAAGQQILYAHAHIIWSSRQEKTAAAATIACFAAAGLRLRLAGGPLLGSALGCLGLVGLALLLGLFLDAARMQNV